MIRSIPSRRAVVLVSLVLFLGAVLTAAGLVSLSWPEVLPWSGKSAPFRFIAFLLVCALSIVAAARLTKLRALVGALMVAVFLALATGGLWPLLVALWFSLASTILGKYLLLLLRIERANSNWFDCFLVGAGVYGTVVGLLAHFPVNYVGLYALGLALPLVLGRRVLGEFLGASLAFLSTKSEQKATLDWLSVAILAVALVHFVAALMPEVMYDALAVHLFVPGHMALRHQWGFDPSLYVWAVTPMLGDWLFSIGYILAGETGARLINLSFICALAWLGRELVIWAGGNEKGVKWATLIFLATPLTYTESSSLFIESIWAVYVVAGVYWLLRLVYRQANAYSALSIAGLMLGLSLAAKTVTLTILPVVGLLLLFRYRTWVDRRAVGPIVAGLTIFVAVGSIPYVTAWLIAGNPVFPFFNGVFKSPYYPAVNFDNPLFRSGVTWDLPFRVTFESGRYLEATAGAAGFQWLLLLAPAVVVLAIYRSWRGMLLFALGVLSVAITFQLQSYLRYVFPAVLLLTATIGVALSQVATREGFLKSGFAFVAALTVVLNLLFFNAGTWSYRNFPIKIVFSETARTRYLEDRLPIRRAVEFVNYLNNSGSPVAIFGQPFGAGLNADALYPTWYNNKFHYEINAANDAQTMAGTLSGYGVRFVLLDSTWGTAEQRGFVEEVTHIVAEFKTVAVRSVRDDYRFSREMLKNPEFSDVAGWSLANGTRLDVARGLLIVSVVSPATQAVSVVPGRQYRNSVTARCAVDPALGRVQVNWLDQGGKFLSTNIRTFDCNASWKEYEMLVTAPEKASVAVVYTTSHTDIPVEFRRNSFRQ